MEGPLNIPVRTPSLPIFSGVVVEGCAVELSRIATHSPLAQTRTHVTLPTRRGAVAPGTLFARTWIMSRIWGSPPVRFLFIFRPSFTSAFGLPSFMFFFESDECLHFAMFHPPRVCRRMSFSFVYHLYLYIPVMTVTLTPTFPPDLFSVPCRTSFRPPIHSPISACPHG